MAESGNNSAAAMIATQPMKIENISLPGFGPSNPKFEFNPLKYRVKYLKLDMDDMGSVAELEILETQGLAGEKIVILNKDKFTFMEKYIMVVCYLEYIEAN